eukprot:scaffold312627_cov32-Tisochrysis_lutea.AAC.1
MYRSLAPHRATALDKHINRQFAFSFFFFLSKYLRFSRSRTSPRRLPSEPPRRPSPRRRTDRSLRKPAAGEGRRAGGRRGPPVWVRTSCACVPSSDRVSAL